MDPQQMDSQQLAPQDEVQLDSQQLTELLNEAFVGQVLSLETIDNKKNYGKGDVAVYLNPSPSYGRLNVSVLVSGVDVAGFDNMIWVEVSEVKESSRLDYVSRVDLRASGTNTGELWCQLEHVPSGEIVLEFFVN